MSRLSAVVFVVVLHAGCAVQAGGHSPSIGSAVEASSSPSPSATATPPATPSPNVQEGVISERARFIGSWWSDPSTPPINDVHEWILHIETADGQPVEGAMVDVDGDMPAHGHGMPTQPQVTEDLGDGDYRVEGMSFQMGGYWVIDVTVTTGDATDVIRFGLEL